MSKPYNRNARFTFVFFSIFLSLNFDVSGQAFAKPVLAKMDTFNRNLKTVRGLIRRIDENAQLRVSDTRRGKLIYAHDKEGSTSKISVRIDFDRPEESLAVQNGRYYMYVKGSNQSYEGPVTSRRGSSKGIPLTFIGMSRRDLESKYQYTYLGRFILDNGEQTTHLKLIPKTKAEYAHVEIWINDNGMPSQSKVVQKNGDSTTILISNYDLDKKINGSEFEIKIPKTANKHVEK